jgi:hypothetical protein
LLGLKVGVVVTVKLRRASRNWSRTSPIFVLVEPLLIVRRAIREQIGTPHHRRCAHPL